MHYGDSSVIIKYKDGTIKHLENPNEIALKKLDNQVLQHLKKIAQDRDVNIAEARYDTEIEKMIKENRAKKNTDEGYWVLGTCIETVEHGTIFEEKAENLSSIMLHSDGFNYEILNLSIKEVLEQCRTQEGLINLQNRIRLAEEDDEYFTKQLRLKKHDDMSVVINEI